jgi:hypothetical protein
VVDVGPGLETQEKQLPGTSIVDLTINGVRHQHATRLAGGVCLLRYWGVCDFTISSSRRHVTIHQLPAVDPGLVAILVEGALPALVLLLEGQGVLHASAVQVDGRGIAFVGRSGMGKSTVAAVVCRWGARLITDDVLRFDVSSDGVRGFRGTGELRLRPAAEGLALPTDDVRMRPTSDGRTALQPDPVPTETASIDVVVLPRLRRDVEVVSAERMSGAQALLSLMRFPRFPGLLDPDLHASQLARVTDLASAIPIVVLDVPWQRLHDPSLGGEVLGSLEDWLDR